MSAADNNVPTDPGWYWFRRPSSKTPYVVLIKRERSGLRCCLGGGGSAPIAAFAKGVWSDRIEPPADMTGGGE